MIDLSNYPTGNVTFVFTDIEGSTPTTRRVGDRPYREKLRDPHRARLLEAVRGHRGFEIGRAGDGHLFVFQLADDALAAVVAFQRSLAADPIALAPERPLRVRVGVHTAVVQGRPLPMALGLAEVPDDAEPSALAPEYSCGGEVNFAARVGSIGDGGQIIVSSSTLEKADARSLYRWHPWPGRRLKGFEDRGRDVHELLYLDGQEPAEPGARLLPAFHREDRNRYIPRPGAEEAVIAPIAGRGPGGSRSRLVTIWAGGGMGKTRLAVACALKLLDLFDGGVHFVGLSLVAPEVEAVAGAIARALDLTGESARPDGLFEALRDRPKTLILLDNYESAQADAVARYLARLAGQTEGLSLLVTGRKKVGVSDVETTVLLDGGMTDAEARELFLARARLKGKLEGEPGPADEAQIARIVALTERTPLALELAAAWTGHVGGLEEIADGLESAPLIGLPPGEVRSDSEESGGRHDSVGRSLAWSFDLLGRFEGDAARLVLASGGLFAASIDPATLADVSGEPSAPSVALLLRNASLFRLDPDDGATRYLLHRSTREFARARLADLPSADAIRRRFLDHYLFLVFSSAGNLSDPARLSVLRREWPNALAAVGVAEALADHRAILDLSRIGPYLEFRGLWPEAESLYLRAHGAARALGDRHAIGVTLEDIGSAHHLQGRWGEAAEAYEAALAICREAGDREGEGSTLGNLGNTYWNQGRSAEAVETYEVALAIARELGNRAEEGRTLQNLGIAHAGQGRPVEAIEAYRQSLAIKRESGDRIGEGRTLNNLGAAHQESGRIAEAVESFERALTIHRELGDRIAEGTALSGLGVSYGRQGRPGEALAAFGAALAIHRELNDRAGEAEALLRRGDVHRDLGQADEAIDDYEQALAIHRERSDRSVQTARLLCNLGDLHGDRGRYDRAAWAWDEAATFLRELGDRANEGLVLGNLGLARQSQGRSAEAIEAYTRAADVCRESGALGGAGMALNNLGNIYDRLGRSAEAVAAFEAALAVKREAGDRESEGWTLNNLANALKNLGRPDEAAEAYRKAAAALHESGDRINEGLTLENLARLRQEQGRIGEAVVLARQAISALEGTEAADHLAKARRTLATLEALTRETHGGWRAWAGRILRSGKPGA